MNASIVDLRYHMNDVLKALNRNEKITIFYRNKKKGIIIPLQQTELKKEVEQHPFFGMRKKNRMTVKQEMDHLRGSRY